MPVEKYRPALHITSLLSSHALGLSVPILRALSWVVCRVWSGVIELFILRPLLRSYVRWNLPLADWLYDYLLLARFVVCPTGTAFSPPG